ncbi:type II secretion system minor pseudopilin GspK [Psychromonas sp. MME2]|uniref:type II secretion system minor pseudopilin GspK n=1 Tax=unclassified Psychromonas TaxID=2614957 RepID=UPI00339CC0BD
MTAVGKGKQNGIALITVLLILAIMVTIAATMTGRLTLSLKRTEGLAFSQKAYWYGQSAISLGTMILNQDIGDSDVISLDQIWATPGMIFPLENGNFAGEIKDLRSCFNINSLAEQDKNNITALGVRQFQSLLEAIGLNDYSAEMIAQSTRDWIDSDDQASALQGAEDSHYQGLAVPLLAANNFMVDLTELRSVQGVSKNIYEKIAPYLCAIPANEQNINVNTVSLDHPEILYALFKPDHDFTISDFKQLLEDRPISGWNNISDFFAMDLFNGVAISEKQKGQLSVSSDFFQLNGVVEYEERLLAIKILFQMKDKKANVIRYQSGGFSGGNISD